MWTHLDPRQNKSNSSTPDFHDKPFSEGREKGEGTGEQKDLFRGRRSKLILITSAVPAKLYGCSFENVFG